MGEGLLILLAVRAGGWGEGSVPGCVGGQVTLACAHLMYSPSSEAVQSHEGVGLAGGREVVVGWRRVEEGPFIQDLLAKELLESRVGPGWGVGV